MSKKSKHPVKQATFAIMPLKSLDLEKFCEIRGSVNK